MARLLLAAACLWASSAAAHLMPVGHGTVNVVGHKAYVVLALPVSSLAGAAGDAAADGRLTPAELATHRAALEAAVRAGLSLTVAGQPARLGRILLNRPQGQGPAHDHDRALTALVVAHLPAAPGPLTVRSTLWGAAPADALKLEVTLTAGGRVTRREVQTLTAAQPQRRFFTSPAPTAAPAHAHRHGAGAHRH